MSKTVQAIRDQLVVPVDLETRSALTREVDLWWANLDLPSKLAAHFLMVFEPKESTDE